LFGIGQSDIRNPAVIDVERQGGARFARDEDGSMPGLELVGT
jgi:hypothetical protein